METVLILGANSDIAKALAIELAKKHTKLLYFVARNQADLERFGKSLTVCYGIEVKIYSLDLAQLSLEEAANFYHQLSPKPECVIYAAGYLGNQKQAEKDLNELKRIMDVNFLAALPFLEAAASDFEQRKAGCLVGIGSVSGMRGRQSNYIYGAAKAGFIAYLSGLRNRLFPYGCHVVTVLPGFVDTKMTAHMSLPKLLTSSPEKIAKRICKAIYAKQDIVYSDLKWQMLMAVIVSLPEKIFKRLKL